MADETAPAAPAAPEVAPAAMPSPSGDWRTGLPTELLAEKSLESFKSVGDLAKSYVETKRMVGGPLQEPGPDAKPEQLAAYRQRLGVPEAPDKYDVVLPKPAEGTGFQWDPHWVGVMKERFHAAHMTPKQIQATADLFAEYMHALHDQVRAQQVQEEQGDLSEAVKVLEQKWGPRNGPMWRHHEARAQTAIRTLLADASDQDRQEVLQLANHPAVAHALSQMADGLIERGFVDSEALPAGVSAGEARARIEEMRTASLRDPDHPLRNARHPDHERTMKQWLEWQRLEAGDGRQYTRYSSR